MNQIFNKISLAFFFSVFILFSCNKNESDSDTGTIHFPDENELSWNYPILPGSAQWKAFQSYKEKADACQIPQNIMTSLSTEELLVLCLKYPLLMDIGAFNFFADGYAAWETNFNGIRELYQRKDAPTVLLAWYKQLNFEQASLHSTISFVFGISVSEYMLSAPFVIAKYTQSQRKEIAAELWSRLNFKKSQPGNFTNDSLNSSYFALVRIIKSDAQGNLSADDTKLANWFTGIGSAPENILKQVEEIIRNYFK